LNDKTRVLVVDDEERILILLQACLEAAGYEVLLAADGRQALNLIEVEQVDAVITDMNMPEIGGLDVIKTVRRLRGKAIPIIVVTAYGSVQNAVEAMHCGATDYLEKPFDMAVLKATLAKWLAEASRERGGC
jgi:DNA-binding NtrC family response regulator